MSTKRNNFKLFIDRALSQNIWKQVLILIGMLVVLLLLSYLMLWCAKDEWTAFCCERDFKLKFWLLPIYLLIDTNALNALYMGGAKGWMLFACSLIYIFGLVVCSGMLIGVITNYISDRVQKHRDGLKYYVKSGHCIIMGYDDMVPSIIKEIFGKMPKADVVLLTAMDAKVVTEKLRRSAVRDKMDQIFVTYGHRMVKDDYKAIHLESAEKIYIVGNRTRPAHDATNVECIDSICSYLSDVTSKQKTRREKLQQHLPKQITCVFEDLDTYAAFKTTEIFSQIGGMGIDFIPYNFYAGWARQVFMRRSYREKNRPDKIDYPSVYGEGITPDDPKYVHLVFVGTTYFSVSFAMEAAHLLHFPNFEKDNNLRTRITFIEKNADEELKLFSTQNRHFFEVQPYFYKDLTKGYHRNEADVMETKLLSEDLESHGFLDVEFEFIKGDVYSSDAQKLIKDWAKDKNHQYLSIFLAMADQRNNFIMGMNMPDEVYDNEVPVFIRQDRADDFVTNLREADNQTAKYYHVENEKLTETVRRGRYSNIYPFGMDDMAYFSDTKALKRAKLINYLHNHTNKNHFPDPLVLNAISSDTLWIEADENWRCLKVAEKWSNLYAAYSIRCKLDSLRIMRGLDTNDYSGDQNPLTSDEMDCMAIVEHNRWNVEKLLMGYRKANSNEDKYNYGKYAEQWKNNQKKHFIHHDIRPFKDLDEIRLLDYEIVKYIPWILSMTEDELN